MKITTYDRVFSQQDIHRFFLKTSVVIAAFLVTSIISQLFNLAVLENKTHETLSIAKAEVSYYKNQKILSPGEQLKWDIASAKLESVKKAIKTNNTMLELNTTITDICMFLAPMFFFFGAFSWLLHLPYVQVTLDGENPVSSSGENIQKQAIILEDNKPVKPPQAQVSS
ncbi:hypothetical protein [Shewanella donghaensis]|uniref:hypothetical protein n=1 Tax=Shewanella donghaensis TaxID=238836 RepID=UPI001182587E|nr:hypothetical protein [Shewanella donghaensis]